MQLWILTLRATLTFNLLLLTVWLTFLMLGASYVDAQNDPEGMPDVTLTRAGGGFGIVAAFLAWYNMFAGMADRSNSFFLIPVLHCKSSLRQILAVTNTSQQFRGARRGGKPGKRSWKAIRMRRWRDDSVHFLFHIMLNPSCCVTGVAGLHVVHQHSTFIGHQKTESKGTMSEAQLRQGGMCWP